jgi:hypothetical protein
MQSSLVFTVIAGVLVGLAFSHGQAFGEEGQNDVFGANSGDDHDASDLSLLQQSLQVNATVTKEDLPTVKTTWEVNVLVKVQGM